MSRPGPRLSGGGDSPPVVNWKMSEAILFPAVRRLVMASAVRHGSLKDKCNASHGAGLIEPAPFQDDPVLTAVKDASRRCAVGLRPILDRGCARRLVDDQAGTEKRLPSRTKKQMIPSGTSMFLQPNRSRRLLQHTRPGWIEQCPRS